MSRTLAILGALSGLALGSCMHHTPDVAGLGWTYQDDTGEGPKLAYGEPHSDNVVVVMTCTPGDPNATLSLLGGSPKGGLTLASGKDKAQLDGAPVPSPGAGHLIEASTDLSSPPLARFARTGDLTLIDRGRGVAINAKGEERRQVSRFFQACRA